MEWETETPGTEETETGAAPEEGTAPEIPAGTETVPETSGAEGYGYITTGYDSGTVTEALDIQTEVIHEQTAAIKAGFAGVCVLLGFLIGVVFIQGIRLRRV